LFPKVGKPIKELSTQVDQKRKRTILIVLVVVILKLIAISLYMAMQYGYFQTVISFIDIHMPPGLFIALMVILPAGGFPISIFLIMGGIKFGILYCILLWLFVLPIHTLISYYLARRARIPLERFLSNHLGYNVPELPEKGVGMFSFLFLAFPGIPYAIKNYIMPLAGVPFRFSVLMNCIVQSAQGIPFIVLGKSVKDMNMTLFYIALVLLILGYLGLGWLKKKHGNQIGKI
jgi:uncharacterized membrane protein YdjX (TVP38/TMEM64 family)